MAAAIRDSRPAAAPPSARPIQVQTPAGDGAGALREPLPARARGLVAEGLPGRESLRLSAPPSGQREHGEGEKSARRRPDHGQGARLLFLGARVVAL